jgi:hypothetical protein
MHRLRRRADIHGGKHLTRDRTDAEPSPTAIEKVIHFPLYTLKLIPQAAFEV